MLSDKEYTRLSLEANLFFLRIFKEHMIFAAASLSPRDRAVANKLLLMKKGFEDLLYETLEIADKAVSQEVLAADELVTDLTLSAEMKTQYLTGIPINTDITKQELELRADSKNRVKGELLVEVPKLNRKAMAMTVNAIAFQKGLLKNINECKAFSYAYPKMQHHVNEESEYYLRMMEKLEKRDAIDSAKEIIEEEITWNDLMGEHSKFIRGYLDPSEEKLFRKADSFAEEFDRLLEKTESAANNPGMLPEVTGESLKDVTELRNFKSQGTMGILKCEIRSVILPLLSDHVTREANHYIRLLKAFSKKA
ncbi:MAG: DUF2935 domain-containing protein [Pseudomonadota bacterium]